MYIIKVRKVAKIRNRYNQVPQMTTWESDKNTNKHHKREPRGQPFPSIQWTNCHKMNVLSGEKLCINSMTIALLVHKIVLIGTWMLKARSTDFIQKYK